MVLKCKFILIGVVAFVLMQSSIVFAKEITLNILCWEGYTKQYTANFIKLMKEKHKVDIKFNIKNISAPQEFWDAARPKKVDLISPAHNILKSDKWKFIKGRVALPIDLKNVPNYKNLLPMLQKNQFVTKGKDVFAVPYTMGPYGLCYNADKVPEPKSWDVLWSEKAKNKFSISKDYPSCNIYVTALVLGANYKEIYDFGVLSKKIGVAKLQKKLDVLGKNAFSLWAGTAQPDEFPKLSYATTWGYAVAAANAKGGNWKMANPKEGGTMWVDHWVITHAVKGDKFKKKICEEWINYCLSDQLQIGVVRNWGVSPVLSEVKGLTAEEISVFNVGNDKYWESLSLWENQDNRTQNGFKVLWKKATKGRK